jgi:hypothetical protein
MKRFSLLAAFLLIGCVPTREAPGEKKPAVDVSAQTLAAEPSGAKDVVAVREASKDGDEVVVVGRVGGSARPFVEGRCAFTLIDTSITPCDDDGCGNPYCEVDKEVLKKSTTLVRVVDGAGNTLATGAKQAFGLELLKTVVVKGKAKKDDKGNMTILASGVFVRN